MAPKTKSFAIVIILLLILFLNISSLLAVAFPFRELNVGEPVPDVTVQGFADDQQPLSFSSLQGRPFIAVFWGADLPEKAEHSAKVLGEIEELSPFLAKRDIRLFSVNVQGDDAQTIREVVDRAGSSMDVYLDRDREAYAGLGLFVMPTVLLVDDEGKVAEGLGYSRDLTDRLKGAVEIMLGEKTPEQVAAELRPEMHEASAEDKAAHRHYDFGMVMLKRRQIDAAIRELSKAVEIDPSMTKAHLQLACLHLQEDRLAEAEESINTALGIEPDSVEVRICLAELKRKKGRPAEAVTDLQSLIESEPDNYRALYVLGKAHEDLQQEQEAASVFKKAYRLIRADTAGSL